MFELASKSRQRDCVVSVLVLLSVSQCEASRQRDCVVSVLLLLSISQCEASIREISFQQSTLCKGVLKDLSVTWTSPGCPEKGRE